MKSKLLLLAVLMVGFLLTAWGCLSWREQVRQEIRASQIKRVGEWSARAVEAVREGMPVIVNVYEAIPALAADDLCCQQVTRLNFSILLEPLEEPFDLSPIRKLANLRYMYFYCGDSFPVLQAAAGMESLEELNFELCGSSPEEIELLTTFPNLKKVTYSQCMSQEEIDKLHELLPQVEFCDYDDSPLKATR